MKSTSRRASLAHSGSWGASTCLALLALTACGGPSKSSPDDASVVTGVTWVRNLGDESYDRTVEGLAELVQDGTSMGYAAAGITGDGKTWVARLDLDGGVVWAKEMGGNPVVPLRVQSAVVPTPQGGLLVGGMGMDGSPHLVEVSPSGAVLRDVAILSPAYTLQALAVRPGRYLAAGGVYTPEGTLDGWVAEFSEELEFSGWLFRSLGTPHEGRIFTDIATEDVTGTSGWIAAGRAGDEGLIVSTLGGWDFAQDGEPPERVSSEVSAWTDVDVVGPHVWVAGMQPIDGAPGAFAPRGGRMDRDLDWDGAGWPSAPPEDEVVIWRPSASIHAIEGQGVWVGSRSLHRYGEDGEDPHKVLDYGWQSIASLSSWTVGGKEQLVVTTADLVTLVDAATNAIIAEELHGCGETPVAMPSAVPLGMSTWKNALYLVSRWDGVSGEGLGQGQCTLALDEDLKPEWGSNLAESHRGGGGVLALPDGGMVVSVAPVAGVAGFVRFDASGNAVWQRFVVADALGKGIAWVPAAGEGDAQSDSSSGAFVAPVRLSGQLAFDHLLVVNENGILLPARRTSSPVVSVSGLHGGTGAVVLSAKERVWQWRSLDDAAAPTQTLPGVTSATALPSGGFMAFLAPGHLVHQPADGTTPTELYFFSDVNPSTDQGMGLILADGTQVMVEQSYRGAFGALPSPNCLSEEWPCQGLRISGFETGSSAWMNGYETRAVDTPKRAIATADGGMLVAADTRGYDYPRATTWLLKLDGGGLVSETCTALTSSATRSATTAELATATADAEEVVLTEVELTSSTFEVEAVMSVDEPIQGKSCSGFVVTSSVLEGDDLGMGDIGGDGTSPEGDADIGSDGVPDETDATDAMEDVGEPTDTTGDTTDITTDTSDGSDVATDTTPDEDADSGCLPACLGKQCGDDGCGNTCGSCTGTDICVNGICADPSCSEDAPVAVIAVIGDTVVAPLTTLQLSSAGSYAPSGSLGKIEWSVAQPPGSQSVIEPSTMEMEPTFEANVVGTYHFELMVWDSAGTPACKPASVDVTVVPTASIHVELVWDTPGDADQTSEGPEEGADVDLHFAHPDANQPDLDKDGASDPWFDFPWDCFWFNDGPNWGLPGTGDDPSLDRDDTDGAGPEIVTLMNPEAGKEYRVGVHYWNDFGYGPSAATVRIYVNAALAYEKTGVELVHHDMWYVARIAWPSGAVAAITTEGGQPKISPSYEHPLFANP